MAKVRRTAYVFFYLEDDYVIDAGALLGGAVPAPAAESKILALAILTGRSHQITRRQLELLSSIPVGGWTDEAGLDNGLTADLVAKGLLLIDGDDAMRDGLRKRDEALSANQWNIYAALYHYMTQWSGVDIWDGDERDVEFAARSRSAVETYVAEHGVPSAAFAQPRGNGSVPLPGHDRDGPLYRALLARRTTRSFDTGAPMTLEQLDTVLRYVFGCHGIRSTVGEILMIKRTSPSGGGLHPIEAYPIVSNVSGVPPGIYHYNVREHSLTLLSELDAAVARSTAATFMCGQSYFATASVSFVLTARYYRNHWKYRRHQRAYAGILMDAAHLTQTLYLVSGELGLGAFVTIALNARDIEQRLGLDGVSEGVIAIAGCGPRAPGRSPLEPEFA
jgi:putative peptide maturation dehydrogenase